jgi:hypothetical protein
MDVIWLSKYLEFVIKTIFIEFDTCLFNRFCNKDWAESESLSFGMITFYVRIFLKV